MKTCPECGCPITEESVCPDCGCPVQQENNSSGEDFNESERYSPFNPNSWFFSAPNIIAKYPKRGDYGKAYPFAGWLLQAWHISYKGNDNKNAIDAINNLFLLFNLWWKLFLFPVAWVIFKLQWWIITLLAISILLPITLDITKTGYDTTSDIMTTWWWICGIGSIILILVGCILFFCGFAESFRRYWPALFETRIRRCKRFALLLKKSLKANDINK